MKYIWRLAPMVASKEEDPEAGGCLGRETY